MSPPSRHLRAAVLALIALALAGPAAQPAVAATAGENAALAARLRAQMVHAGAYSGAFVRDVTDGRTLFAWRSTRTRILASNTKLFTVAALLDRAGPEQTLSTVVLAAAPPDESGVVEGHLFLRGGGDPTFGSRAFARRMYRSAASVEALAGKLVAGGLRRVTGGVIGDESRYDRLRGGPDSGHGISPWVGPLSALAYNRGLARQSGTAFQANPPAFAAAKLAAALRARGVRIADPAQPGATPAGAIALAEVKSPTLARLAAITNKRSDNFFAELFAKETGRRARRRGATGTGARAAAAFAGRLGVPARLVDGSGLSRGNRAAPRGVARLLDRLRRQAWFPAFRSSLAVAGRDGTLAKRMRRGYATGNCRAKTGTLSNVSALSGYCTARDGDTIVFSFLMNGVYPPSARRLQNRMAEALARYPG